MRKKIAILGSTGSIGQSSLDIIRKNSKKFNIMLLSANSNYTLIKKQIKKYKPKFFVISDLEVFNRVKKKFKNNKIKIFNKFSDIPMSKIKFDITISSIVGIAGLEPTIKFIKKSKKLLLANKETIICGWHIIKNLCKKNKCEIVPIDSEHFSIDQLTKNHNDKDVKKIYITASGGPFLNKPLKYFKKIKVHNAIKHPKWKMGKKISIDSATMMNKVFEVIEAQRIFNLDINKFKILIHPKSYLHAIIKFENGTIKTLMHDTDMKIPIFNSIYLESKKELKTKGINLSNLNNLNLTLPDIKRFPSLKLLKKINNKISLFETLLIATNDELVKYFLHGKIKFTDINKYLNKVINLNQFRYCKSKKPRDIKQINALIEEVRLKTKYLCIK